jgi:predicted DNA-binding antitoxin AbrB/MazE fold protein
MKAIADPALYGGTCLILFFYSKERLVMNVNKIKLPDGTTVNIVDENTLNEVKSMRKEIRELKDAVGTLTYRINDIMHMIEELKRDVSYLH